MSIKAPPYDQLPIELDAPAGSAWGVFDKDGKRDALGTLNFITPGAVVAAKEEIQTGESVALKSLHCLLTAHIMEADSKNIVSHSTFPITRAPDASKSSTSSLQAATICWLVMTK